MANNLLDLGLYLGENEYPGRGILLGKSKDGEKSVIAYFIMGRSENSRNRVFEKTEDGIRTKAYDPAKLSDPSLIIYHPVRQVEKATIVTNGDQTDTVRDFLLKGKCFAGSLRTREFEPDAPNYTPRISGLMSNDGSYKLSILKSNDGDPSCCCRYFFEYDNPKAGVGHIIHTYEGNGNPLPSFRGEPRACAIPGDNIDEVTDFIWNKLNIDNKVSLYVRFTDLKTLEFEERIVNKNV